MLQANNISYLFYLEGIRIPVEHVSIERRPNSPAVLSVSIFPLREASYFVRGMGALLFKQVNSETPVLEFWGVLSNSTYTRQDNTSYISLVISTVDIMFNRLHFFEIAALPMCGAASVDPAKQAASRLTHLNRDAGYSTDIAGAGASITDDKVLALPDQEDEKISFSYTMAGKFVRDIFQSDHLLKGLFNSIKKAFTESNTYWKNEYIRLHIDKIFDFYDITNASADLDLFTISSKQTDIGANIFKATQAKEKDATAYKNQTKYIRYTTLLSAIQSFAQATSIDIKVSDFINRLLVMAMSTYTMDPGKITKAWLVAPNMHSFIPPKCNVLFPCQIGTLSYVPDMWNEPTRSIFQAKSYINEYASIITGRNDIPLSSVAVVPSALGEKYKKAVGKKTENTINGPINDIMTLEETIKGIRHKYRQINGTSFIAGLADDNFMSVAENTFWQDKYVNRDCTLECSALSNLVVGAPVLILDKYLPIYGTVSQIHRTTSSSGQIVLNVRVASPRYLTEETPAPPKWLDVDALKPENISAIYREKYGCDSAYEDLGVGITPTDKTQVAEILQSINDMLLKVYNNTSDKQLFAYMYTKRKELTLDETLSELGLKVSSEDSIGPTVITGTFFSEADYSSVDIINSTNAPKSNYVGDTYKTGRIKRAYNYFKELIGITGYTEGYKDD